MIMTTIKSQYVMTSYDGPHCRTYMYAIQIESWLRLVHTKTDIDVCALQWFLSTTNMTRHFSLPGSWPWGQLFPWLIGTNDKSNRHIGGCMKQVTKKDNLQNSQHLCDKTLFNIRIAHSLWQLKCSSTLHFLSIRTSFGIQRKWTKVFKNPVVSISY